MASRPEQIELQPGGLNLLAPVDRLAGDDALRLDGWWPASVGRLQQGLGFTLKVLPNFGIFVDSMLQVGGKFYYGGGGYLFEAGRNANNYIDSGYDTQPLGLTASQNYAWMMNQARQKKDDGSRTSNWTTETPNATAPNYYTGALASVTVTAGAGTDLLAGVYDIYVTFENRDGHQGNPTPIKTVTIGLGDRITVNRPTRAEIDSTGGYVVTGWNVYIKSPGMAQPYQIPQNVLDYASRATYDYDGTAALLQTDEGVIAFGVTLAYDHDPAPAAMVAADNLFNSRVLVANSAAHTNRMWWSNASEPSYFPGSAGDPEGNWADVGEDDGDPILAILVRPGLAMIYRRRSIWRQVGDFDDANAKLEPVVPDMGVVGPRGAVATGLGDFFTSDEGIYRLNDWPTKVSPKIEPIFLSGSPAPSTYETILDSWRSHCALGFENGRLWFSYPGGGAPTQGGNTRTLILHVESNRWFGGISSLAGDGVTRLPIGFGVFSNCGNNDAEFNAGSLYVYRLSPSVGSAWPPLVEYQSGYQDCGLPDHEKSFPDVVISHNTRGLTLNVTAWLNKGAEFYTVGSLRSNTLTRQVIPLQYPFGAPRAQGEPLRGSNLAIGIAGSGASGGDPVVIDGPIILHWYDRPRQAKVFDSGETDFGIQGYKQVDAIEFDVDCPTAGLWQLSITTDLGEGAFIPLPRTRGRMVVQATFAPTSGRLLRFLLARSGNVGDSDTFELYGLRARVLPIGVYVDGAAADFWMTQPISIGV